MVGEEENNDEDNDNAFEHVVSVLISEGNIQWVKGISMVLEILMTVADTSPSAAERPIVCNLQEN